MKKNLFKRMMTLLLTLSLLLPLVATAEAEAFDARSICEGVTLTIAVADDNEVPDWENTYMTQLIQDTLGVDLVFQVYPAADYLDKLNVMVNGGDTLPDIIFKCDSNSINTAAVSWAADEAIIPLNKYYKDKNYSANFWAGCEALGVDILPAMTDADGNVWSLPSYQASPTNETPSKMWYNHAWAKKLGFDEIVTIDDYYELCKAVVAAGDLNGNGKADEVCMTSYAGKLTWFTHLMNAFVYASDDYYLDVQDGEVRFAFTTEEWKEGLKYIRKFFEEGLYTTNLFTQDKSARDAQQKGKEAITLAFWDYYVQNADTENPMNQQEVRAQYECVPALQGPTGLTQVHYVPSVPNTGAVITVDCKNPDAAFLVLDFMLQEELSISNRYGQRGVDWDYWADAQQEKAANDLNNYAARVSSEEIYIIAYSDGTYWGKGNPQYAGYMQAGPCLFGGNVWSGIATAIYDENDPENGVLNAYKNAYNTKVYGSVALAHEDKYMPEETIVTLPMTADESEEASDIYKTMESYVNESIAKFLTGEWDIDGYWDTYMGELEKIGYQDALAIYQTAYDRTK